MRMVHDFHASVQLGENGASRLALDTTHKFNAVKTNQPRGYRIELRDSS